MYMFSHSRFSKTEHTPPRNALYYRNEVLRGAKADGCYTVFDTLWQTSRIPGYTLASNFGSNLTTARACLCKRKAAWLTQTEGPCAAGSTGRPLVCKTSCGQERPRSLARGSAHEAPHGFFNAPRLNRGRLGKRAASPLPLSASPRLAAAQFGPGRLGRSDVKFNLSRLIKIAVVVCMLLFGAVLHCPGVLLFSRSRKSCHSAF